MLRRIKKTSGRQPSHLLTPGHRGVKGNETADRLAKLATKQNPTGLEPVIGTSNRSVTEDINKCLAEGHQKVMQDYGMYFSVSKYVLTGLRNVTVHCHGRG